MAKKKRDKKIAVFDFETDPFLHGRRPAPFCAGFYDGTDYAEFWGAGSCVDRLIDHINSLADPHIIYAHNGGKFDFFYLLEKGVLENPLKIINGRIVEAHIGIHKLRDSYAIIPVPLAAYQKEHIDYALMETDKREANKPEILRYLKTDCEYLFNLVMPFVKRFGPRLTIGGTAIKQLQQLHPFEAQSADHDTKFRPFYFGGRVQCFESGIIEGDFKIYDVNSMYPAVMRNFDHPTGGNYTIYSRNVLDAAGEINGKNAGKPYFIHFVGHNLGAFPTRTKSGLDFTIKQGEFFTTSHEFKIALKYGLVGVSQVLAVYIPQQTIRFTEFVDTYAAEKIAAKQSGDKVSELFAKLLLNSAYGKFATNPNNFFDYAIVNPGDNMPFFPTKETRELDRENQKNAWQFFADYDGFEILRKPVSDNQQRYFDVATAASITGAARAVLLEAVCQARRPIYCDTDSLICESLGESTLIDGAALGAWKLEGEAARVAIAGKKLYAAWDSAGECIKLASKGVHLAPEEILHAARGGRIVWQNQAPSFKLASFGAPSGRPIDAMFITRVLNRDGAPLDAETEAEETDENF